MFYSGDVLKILLVEDWMEVVYFVFECLKLFVNDVFIYLKNIDVLNNFMVIYGFFF